MVLTEQFPEGNAARHVRGLVQHLCHSFIIQKPRRIQAPLFGRLYSFIYVLFMRTGLPFTGISLHCVPDFYAFFSSPASTDSACHPLLISHAVAEKADGNVQRFACTVGGRRLAGAAQARCTQLRWRYRDTAGAPSHRFTRIQVPRSISVRCMAVTSEGC